MTEFYSIMSSFDIRLVYLNSHESQLDNKYKNLGIVQFPDFFNW